MKKLLKSARNKQGFSLVELSIVLVIVGIMMYGATSMFTITAEKARLDATNTTLDAIERALKLHYRTVRDLPCPADGRLALTDANFGIRQETVDGTCVQLQVDNWSVANIDVGVVPTRTLNLPDSYMFDGWGNKITYVIDNDCDITTISWATAITGCAATANITVQDNNVPTQRTANAAYVIISHGKNGVGAWRRNGGATRIPSVATTSTHEIENAAVNTAGVTTGADTIFRDDFIKDWDGIAAASYFDDIVRWKVPAQISYED